MSTIFTEANYENSVIELFRNDLGYEYVYGPDIERDFYNPLYEDVLRFDLSRCFSAKHYISENSVQNIRRADNPQRLRIIGSKVLFYL